MADGGVWRLGMLEPFIADGQHRLSEVQRCEPRTERNGDGRISQYNVFVTQARPLRAEEDGGGDVGVGSLMQPRCACSGGELRLGLIANARGGRQDELAVGDCRTRRLEDPNSVQNPICAGGHGLCRRVRPTVPGRNQAQIVKTAIGHSPHSRADVLAELRFDQNDGWGGHRIRPL